MTKTPEQMAEEYRIWVLENDHREIEKPGGHLSIAFLAGYQAAKDEYETKISELEIELENWKHTAIHGDEGL